MKISGPANHMGVHHDATGTLSTDVYAHLMTERWFGWTQSIQGSSMGWNLSRGYINHFLFSYTALLGYSTCLFQNSCIVIFSSAVLQWFCSFSVWDRSFCCFFLLCLPNRCSSTNPLNLSNQSLAPGLSTRLLLTKQFWCDIVSSPISSSLSVLLAWPQVTGFPKTCDFPK